MVITISLSPYFIGRWIVFKKIILAGVVLMFAGALTSATPVQPTFVSATGVITIPSTTGVDYRRADTNAVVPAGTVTIAGTTGASLIIYATPKAGYYFPANADDDWAFVRTA